MICQVRLCVLNVRQNTMVVGLITNIIASGRPSGPGLVVGFLSIASLGALVRLNLAVERFMVPAIAFGALSLFLALVADAGFGGSILFGIMSFLFGMVFFGRLKASEGERNWKTTFVTGVLVYLIWIVVLL